MKTFLACCILPNLPLYVTSHSSTFVQSSFLVTQLLAPSLLYTYIKMAHNVRNGNKIFQWVLQPTVHLMYHRSFEAVDTKTGTPGLTKSRPWFCGGPDLTSGADKAECPNLTKRLPDPKERTHLHHSMADSIHKHFGPTRSCHLPRQCRRHGWDWNSMVSSLPSAAYRRKSLNYWKQADDLTVRFIYLREERDGSASFYMHMYIPASPQCAILPRVSHLTGWTTRRSQERLRVVGSAS